MQVLMFTLRRVQHTQSWLRGGRHERQSRINAEELRRCLILTERYCPRHRWNCDYWRIWR